MSATIPSDELRNLRNQIPLREVIYALRVPWKMDDDLFRFKCPKCKGDKTSIHPTENLGRCFSCKVNFNAIDLVMHIKNIQFRSAVEWLRSLKRAMGDKDYSTLIVTMAKKSRME